MAGQVAPSELFPDVVNARLHVDFHFVGGLGALHVTGDLLPGGHDEGVIAARTDPRGVVATCDRGAEPAAAGAKRFASRYSFWSIRSRTAARAARSSST